MSGRDFVTSQFPEIRSEHFKITSNPDYLYNCFSWAIEDKTRWWWPAFGRYWPPGAAFNDHVDTFVAVLNMFGYELCDFDPSLDEDYEKIVIYANEFGQAKHLARQLGRGVWTSKLGPSYYISHHKLDDLAGEHYGKPAQMVRRSFQRGVTPSEGRRRKGRHK